MGVENVSIDTIDLEGLKDIVYINPQTLQEADANNRISESLFEGIIFPSGYESKLDLTSNELRIKKIRRKIYFPFTQSPNEYGISLAPHYSQGGYEDNEFKRDLFN